MDHPLRRPEEILAYRSLKELLADKQMSLWTVGPKDSALTAMRLMAEKNIGFLVVMESGAIVGVLSERDCVRRLAVAGKSPEVTPVADVMTRDVIKADLSHKFVDCLRLMDTHGIRHLPLVENGAAIGVISVRDLLREAVAHHEKVIDELERERMTMFTSTA
jgi:signal-transduction protein with cAMP-binding, CBS, and nucleotidyltransferase domain